MAEIFQRVPWRSLNPASSGPKPSENVNTFTPAQRATRKCPSSWKKTTIVSTNKKGMMYPMNPWLNVLKLCRKRSAIQFPSHRAKGPVPNPLGCLCGNLRQEGGSFISRIMVNGNRVVRGAQWREVSRAHPVVHGGLDQPRDGPEPDLAGDEGGDRDLVGRVVDR